MIPVYDNQPKNEIMKALTFLIFFLFLTSVSIAQNINIPDTNFKNALISSGVDTNEDGEISFAESVAITKLDVSDNNISDMTGIEAFINLDSLDCHSNKLTSLDVSNNKVLDSLNCSENLLSNLDVSNNTQLTWLICGFNYLTGLDVSNNTALKVLQCHFNQISSLDIANNTALNNLSCSYNKLTSLNVYYNPDIATLWCNNNQLTSLDVSNNSMLNSLNCWNNKLTSLDVYNNAQLAWLMCGFNFLTSLDVSNNAVLSNLSCEDNNLTSLDISNNAILTQMICSRNPLTNLDISNNAALNYLVLSGMPTLQEVCVWGMPFPPAGIYVDTSGSSNIYFTSDCFSHVQGDYIEKSSINVYPNPCDDIINLEIEDPNHAVIEIYNVNGSLIYSESLQSKFEKIDVSDFSKGVYLIKVKQEGTTIVGKVVVI
jgi:Leucine-rich repeat (LRR) protein